MHPRSSRTTAIAFALSGVIATGGLTAAQETDTEPEVESMMAPAFEWALTSKLPGLAKLDKYGCPYSMEDAAFTPSGSAIVVGGEFFGCGIAEASAWRSDDAVKWSQQKLKGQRASGLAVADAGTVVVGSASTVKGSNALVWVSEGDGPLKAATTIKNASLSDVLITPDGYEAVGVSKYKQGYGFPTAWSSSDGQDWGSPVRLGDKRGFPPVAAVGPSGVRLVVDPSRTDGILWRSEDGTVWEELSVPKEIRGKKIVGIWDIEGDDSGFIMAISGLGGERSKPQLWRSDDGRDWTPVAVPGQSISGIVSGPLGYFVFTRPPSDNKGNFKKGKPGVLLWSEDGSDWCRLRSEDLARRQVSGSDVAADGRLLLTGVAGHSFSGTPYVLLGTPIDGQTVPCTPVPAPEGLPETITFTTPVIEPPSMVAACSDSDAREAADDSMYCISDLIAKGSKKVKSSRALKDAPSSFKKDACVKPAGGAAQNRAMLCLYTIAQSWRTQQREAEVDGMVTKKAFDKILPTYQWAASTLSKADKDYLDRGLTKLDRMPLGWERQKAKKLKTVSAVGKAPTRNASADALRKTLQAAWLQSDMAPIPDALIEMPGGWDEPAVPSGPFGPGYPMDGMSYYVGPKGGVVPQTDLVSKCELAVNPSKTPNVSGTIRTETCGRAAGSAWLLYLATGDQRFVDVAVGIRDMALRASSTEGFASGLKGKEKLFLQTFECWAGEGKGDRGCYSGI